MRGVSGEMGRAQTLLRPLITKPLRGGLDDGYCALHRMNAGIDFSFKGHSVEMCF